MRSGCFQGRGRNAAWEVEIEIQREPFGFLQEISDALDPQNVCDLMGIRNDTAGAPWDYRIAKMSRAQERAFNVDMSVNKARSDILPVHFQVNDSIIVSPPDDPSLVDSQVHLFDPPREYVD
jgi:hypothetical protein